MNKFYFAVMMEMCMHVCCCMCMAFRASISDMFSISRVNCQSI